MKKIMFMCLAFVLINSHAFCKDTMPKKEFITQADNCLDIVDKIETILEGDPLKDVYDNAKQNYDVCVKKFQRHGELKEKSKQMDIYWKFIEYGLRLDIYVIKINKEYEDIKKIKIMSDALRSSLNEYRNQKK